jgi:hypothetical protein
LGEETAASRPPAVQLNSILSFSAKTDPRESPEKNPEQELEEGLWMFDRIKFQAFSLHVTEGGEILIR